MRFGTSDHIFNIHDVQLIIIFISLTKIKDIVESTREKCPKFLIKSFHISEQYSKTLLNGMVKNICPKRRRRSKCYWNSMGNNIFIFFSRKTQQNTTKLGTFVNFFYRSYQVLLPDVVIIPSNTNVQIKVNIPFLYLILFRWHLTLTLAIFQLQYAQRD
jgi:hypothetical protein